jgi:hypothetical protein
MRSHISKTLSGHWKTDGNRNLNQSDFPTEQVVKTLSRECHLGRTRWEFIPASRYKEAEDYFGVFWRTGWDEGKDYEGCVTSLEKISVEDARLAAEKYEAWRRDNPGEKSPGELEREKRARRAEAYKKYTESPEGIADREHFWKLAQEQITLHRT